MSKTLLVLLLAMLALAACNNLRNLKNDSEDDSHDEQEAQASKFDLESLVRFRQDIHQNPEPGFHEFRTQKKLIKYLKSLGVRGSSIKKIATTGLQVDIAGRGKASGEDRVIAFRADIDALDIVEDNPTLPYRSTNGNAHACGHDGHMTSTLGFAAKLMDVIGQIPKNKVVRLLFQPSEEGPDIGAPAMIEEGCLEGVNEIYGWHNAAQAPVGFFATTDGMMLGQTTYLNLKIHGLSGHAATSTFIDPVQLSVSFFNELKTFNANITGHDFILNFPYFKAAERWNVGADIAELRGAFRTTEIGFDQVVKAKFIEFLDDFKTRNKIDYTLEWRFVYHPVVNDHDLTTNIVKVATSFFGTGRVVPAGLIKNSEDFSYYQLYVPGNYFYLGSAVIPNDRFVHNKKYNFNDNLIPVAAGFLYTLALDRLGVTIA